MIFGALGQFALGEYTTSSGVVVMYQPVSPIIGEGVFRVPAIVPTAENGVNWNNGVIVHWNDGTPLAWND